jgi:hypothetical protein
MVSPLAGDEVVGMDTMSYPRGAVANRRGAHFPSINTIEIGRFSGTLVSEKNEEKSATPLLDVEKVILTFCHSPSQALD